MADKVYCYPDSDVLRNKLDIWDVEQLYQAERKLTMLRILELIEKPISGAFDLKHLQAIHRYIFQDVYPWAGEIRTVDIAKGNMFCKVEFIEGQATELFGRLKKENYLKGLSEDVFIRRMAYYFSEMNALHPFREGNGRSQREFIRCLALYNGYKICFANADKDEMLSASEASFLCEYDKMEQLFRKCLERKNGCLW
ncbi:MAG: Fic family protein [Roseburia sp.]|nr:Fic family protein [Roseburia sp.]